MTGRPADPLAVLRQVRYDVAGNLIAIKPLLDDMRRLGRHQTLHLTDRELDVLYLMADGRERNEIADTLHLSPETVKYYTTHVIQKLGARNKAHAVHLADQQGLLEAA